MKSAKVLAIVFALGVAVAVAGCNTIKGAGKDVQQAGKAVERAADKAKN